MRQVNTIAEQELQHMFAEHGSHVAVCEALLEEVDCSIEKMICEKEAEAYRESQGIDKRATRQSKKKVAVVPGPKKVSLSELIAQQAEELKEDATMPLAADINEEDEKPEVVDEFTEEDFNRPEEEEEDEEDEEVA